MILICGGAGYIGSHLCYALHQKGFQTVVFDNLSTGHPSFVKWSPLFKGDLKNKTDINACFKQYPIKAVMHLCAHSLVSESMKDPLAYYNNNVKNTLNLLETMLEYKISYFIFSSSAAVYGTPNKLPISETHPVQPISPYGQTKAMVEQILHDFSKSYALHYCALLYFNACGAAPEANIGERHEPESHLIPNLITHHLNNKPSTIFGKNHTTKDGTCIRDYIHVKDLASAHIKALTYIQDHKTSAIFNLGTETGYSILEIIKEIEMQCKTTLSYSYAPKREGDPPSLIASYKKAKEYLNWTPKHTLSETIKDALYWHQIEQKRKPL